MHAMAGAVTKCNMQDSMSPHSRGTNQVVPFGGRSADMPWGDPYPVRGSRGGTLEGHQL